MHYKGLQIDGAYRLDFVVDGSVIVEVKSVERLTRLHEAQLLTYMRLSAIPVGLLLNFNCARLVAGVRRLMLKPSSHPCTRAGV